MISPNLRLISLATLLVASFARAASVPLFDGKSFEGWEGDTQKTWRIKEGAIVGGSLTENVPRNEFLATKKSFHNFELRLKFKLLGSEGFVNSGVQIRSVRIAKPAHEMSGYQCDIGDPNWWGALYDESRRNKVLAPSDMKKLEPVLKRGDWNDYRIRAEGPRIQLWINGVQTIDYTEPDPKIPQDGHIAVQVHGGGKAEVWFKDITIEELPPTPNAPKWPEKASAGAPAAAEHRTSNIQHRTSNNGPRTAEEERAAFNLPEGFVAELVADESVMRKAVAFNFDTAGRMWVTTASEYPLDANEQPDQARALYEKGGKDTVLVFDTPWAEGLQKPRVFAGVDERVIPGAGEDRARDDRPPTSKVRHPTSESPDPGTPSPPARPQHSTLSTQHSPFPLAMPMGVLPYKDGAIVQHGQDLLFLRDTDGDGRADKKEVLLTGFGIQDSHLMPHGFTRGPGDWIYFAQGAFNTSHVKTKEGPVIESKHCKLMRMKPDGSRFEIVGWGLNNIWGFAIDPRGEMWVQEANDMGYPVAPFQVGMAYPGIGEDKPKPYAPFMPPPRKLNDCTMGGTGLSGLALNEDASTWPAPWTGAFMIANPITNKLQAVRVHRGTGFQPVGGESSKGVSPVAASQPGEASATPTGRMPVPQATGGYGSVALEKLPDFLVSEDKSFRPVAIQFGPDGALYVIDWYNKIISHNEVPRTHPERDKTRSRIWRIRWTGAPKREVPNLQKSTPEQLVERLGSPNQWEANSARFELIDRRSVQLASELEGKLQAADPHNAPVFLQMLWVLEGWLPHTEPRDAWLHWRVVAPLLREQLRILADTPIAGNEVPAEILGTIPKGALGPRGQKSAVETGGFGSSVTYEFIHDFGTRWQFMRAIDALLGPPEPLPDTYSLSQFDSGDIPRSAWSAKDGDWQPSYIDELLYLVREPERHEPAVPVDAVQAKAEDYLMRWVLERHPRDVLAWAHEQRKHRSFFASEEMLALASLPPMVGAPLVARAAEELQRPLRPSELGLLSSELRHSDVAEAFTKILRDPAQQASALAALANVNPRDVAGEGGAHAPSRAVSGAPTGNTSTPAGEAADLPRNDAARPNGSSSAGAPKSAREARALPELIAEAARDLLKREPNDTNRRLVLKLATTHRLTALEPEVMATITAKRSKAADQIEALKALREIGSNRVDLFFKLASAAGGDAKQNEELRREAVTALAGAKNEQVVPMLAQLWPSLVPAVRRIALDRVASSKEHGTALVAALRSGTIPLDDLDPGTIEKLTAATANEPTLKAELEGLLAELKGTTQPVLHLTGEADSVVGTQLELRGPFTVETWIKLDAGISNEDALLGSKAGPNFNFYDARLRVYAGPAVHDALIAKTAMKPDTWTHVAITRDPAGNFRIYRDGELDAEGGKPWQEPFTGMDIGRSNLAKATGAKLTEFRVWSVTRTPDEIRNNYLRSFAGEPLPPQVQFAFLGAPPIAGGATAAAPTPVQLWHPKAPKLAANAHVQGTRDFPELLTDSAARAIEAKFAQFRSIIAQPGKAEHGSAIFTASCAVCHRVKGEGGQVGPDLSGAGAMGEEALLRNILTPNAQLESGYYRHDIELKNGDLLSGFLVKEDAESVTLRPVGSEDRRIPRNEVTKRAVSRRSLMPEGLLDGMQPQEVSDLFAYLRTLK